MARQIPLCAVVQDKLSAPRPDSDARAHSECAFIKSLKFRMFLHEPRQKARRRMSDTEFKPRRIRMSLVRNTVLALTAAVTFGAAMTSTTTTTHAWHKPHWKKWYWHHHHHGYWHRPYYRPYYYSAPVVYSAPRPAPRIVSAPPQPPVQAQAPAQNPANCLSKAYTPEGQVVFSDNCTKESAMAPVPNVPQQGSQQLQPQQQSEAGAPQQQNFAGKSFRKFGNAQPQQEQPPQQSQQQ
jgi:hypothetical protein